MVKCALCADSFVSIPQFRIHLKISHGDATFFRYSCAEDSCSRSFDTWRVFRNHLVKIHNIPIHHPVSSRQIPVLNSVVAQEGEETGNFEDHQNPIAPIAPLIEQTISPAKFQTTYEKSVKIFVAKLYQNPSIPRNFVQTIIDDVDNFVDGGFLEILKDSVLTYLKSFQSPQSTIDDVSFMFDVLSNPFKGLSTDYRRMEHFKSTTYYVPPVSYTISESCLKLFNTREGPVTKRIKTQGVYVPLRCVLKNLFEIPGALSETLQYVECLKNADPKSISNVIQGDVWKSKVSKFNDTDIVIPLNFYFDEVEPDSALGPHSDKLGAGYVLIPVLPPSCQSKLENILLALLFYSDDRKSIDPDRVSYNKEIFEPLIHESSFLESEGILCNTELGKKRMYFVLSQVIGDNLGVHGIMGFVEGFTANYPCTICRAPKERTRFMTREDPALLRNSDNYAEDVLLNDVSLNGIKEECVFNNLKSFHVIDSASVDVMHHGAEGMCHYVLIPVLKHFVDAQFLNIDTLNSRLYFFDYGPSDSSNKVPCIVPDFYSKNKLKCTASEMFSLVRILSVLIGDLIPQEDPYWHLYKLLKQIIEICLAKHISSDVIDLLDLLVDEHHTLFLKLTGRTLPPKLHYFLHYGRIIMRSGPVVHISSMRGEAKHRDITKYTNAITSRRNLPSSGATKHQLGMCFRFLSKLPLLPEMVCGPDECIDLLDHPHYFSFKSSLPPHLKGHNICRRVTWVDFHGTRYMPRMVLVLGANDSGLKFGKIVDIFISNKNPLFICKLLNNIGPCEHVTGYEVLDTSFFKCISHQDLSDPFPLYDFVMSTGARFVLLKHYI